MHRRRAGIGIALALVAGDGPAPAECAACHEEVAAAWRGSRHAMAATNPVFTASWEHWPNGWCLTCHAPREASQVARLGAPAVPGAIHRLGGEIGPEWAWGVDCATCHLRDGVVLAGGRPSAAAVAAHPAAEDPRLRSGELCATCHEFTFQLHTPRWPFAVGDTPAQETWSEWRGSRVAAEKTCADCHLEGHTFPGAHTPSLVRGLVKVDVSAVEGGVRAVVSAPGAPHRVPTGDPFRRMELEICADDACEVVVGRATLLRRFRTDETSWVLAEDRTIPPDGPGEPVREIRVEAVGARFWRLVYKYGDTQFEHLLPAEEVGFEVVRGVVR